MESLEHHDLDDKDKIFAIALSAFKMKSFLMGKNDVMEMKAVAIDCLLQMELTTNKFTPTSSKDKTA